MSGTFLEYNNNKKKLINVFKQKTIFAKVVIVWRYQVIVSGFGKFHQKEFSAVHPLLQLLLAVGHGTLLSIGARALEKPAARNMRPLKHAGQKKQNSSCTWMKVLETELTGHRL